MMKATNLFSKHNTGYDSSARAPQATAEGNWVLDVNMCFDGEGALAIAPENVEGDASDEVLGGVKRDVSRVLALAFVGYAAVEGQLRRGLGAVNGDGELEVDGEGEANDVEARADIGGRAGSPDGKGL